MESNEIKTADLKEIAGKAVKSHAGQRVPFRIDQFVNAYNNPNAVSADDVARALSAMLPNRKVTAAWVRNTATRLSKAEGSGIMRPAERFTLEGRLRVEQEHRAAARERLEYEAKTRR